jgi:mRNA-degrading endonuclease YafQ of YafQ-DinJ toxin-antitoxin module
MLRISFERWYLKICEFSRLLVFARRIQDLNELTELLSVVWTDLHTKYRLRSHAMSGAWHMTHFLT